LSILNPNIFRISLFRNCDLSSSLNVRNRYTNKMVPTNGLEIFLGGEWAEEGRFFGLSSHPAPVKSISFGGGGSYVNDEVCMLSPKINVATTVKKEPSRL
jgi:hypothetical protein